MRSRFVALAAIMLMCCSHARAALISSFTITNALTSGPAYPASNPLGITVTSPVISGGPPVLETAKMSVFLQSVSPSQAASLDAAIIGGGSTGTQWDLSVDVPALATASYPPATSLVIRFHFDPGAGQQAGVLSASNFSSSSSAINMILGWTIPNLGKLSINFDGTVYGNNPLTVSNASINKVDDQTQDLAFTLNASGISEDSEVFGIVLEDEFLPLPGVPLPPALWMGLAAGALLVPAARRKWLRA